jgi:hypothetical protein
MTVKVNQYKENRSKRLIPARKSTTGKEVPVPIVRIR